jgi:hypothetical protein
LTKAVGVDVLVLVDVDGILLFVITGYESEQIYRGIFREGVNMNPKRVLLTAVCVALLGTAAPAAVPVKVESGLSWPAFSDALRFT